MFKKFFVTVLFILFAASLVFAETSSIGYVDVQKVFKEYKETSKAQKELAKEEESFKKEFEDSQKKLKKILRR